LVDHLSSLKEDTEVIFFFLPQRKEIIQRHRRMHLDALSAVSFGAE
jgi:hypothetical protein